MANSDVSLSFKFSRPWVASSHSELIGMLQEEAEVWSSFEGSDASFNPGYGNFVVELTQFEDIDPEDFNPSNVNRFLPPSASPTGALFLDALRDGDIERYRCLVYAFFVSNGWGDSPFLVANTVHGSNFRYRDSFDKYLTGMALLGGATGSSNDEGFRAVGVSSDKVKSQLSALKADMSRKSKLLQFSLANARSEVAKLREDRHQVRSIAASGQRIATTRFEADRSRWNQNFSDTHDHFTKQLEYKAAVALWAERARGHRSDARTTKFWLAGTGAAFIIVILTTLIFFGDFVASSFVRETCDQGGVCTTNWSAKGPLTIGSILLIASLALWLLRTLNKFFLSSKHLASDAEERKAFVQTFLALREDEAVDEKHEAIVLAALFRPTQDGVVSDDNSPLDPSIVSILSRRLSS